jgi:phospholipid/cholesterol/gamma-HCH transport system substrate-binding protein
MTVLRWLRELVNPSRAARAIPFGRLAIGTVFAAAAIFVGYSLSLMGLNSPLGSDPYRIEAEFPDAAGLDAANSPPVSVAGVPAGRVVGVRQDHGRAIVRLELDTEIEGKVFRDAIVRVRPLNGANILTVNIEAGHRATGALPNGARIGATQTDVPVGSDRLLSVLSADTRAFLEILTQETATGVKDRGNDLAQALAQLGPLSDAQRDIAAMLRRRRTLISELVGETTKIFATLGRRRTQLASAVNAATRVLSVTGSHDRALAAAVRELPVLLAQARAAGAAISETSPGLERAFAALTPGTRAFAPALRNTRAAIAPVQRLVDASRELTRGTRQPVRDLRTLATELGKQADPALTGTKELAEIVRIIADHQEPVGRFAETGGGVVSTQDAYTVGARLRLIGVEPPKPEDLGLGAGTSRAETSRMLGRALAATCRKGTVLACIAGVLTPGVTNAGGLR